MHKQLVTLQRERKLEIASYDPFKKYIYFLLLFFLEPDPKLLNGSVFKKNY